MSEKIVQLNEEIIKGQIKELVRGSVEIRAESGTVNRSLILPYPAAPVWLEVSRTATPLSYWSVPGYAM